MSLGVFGAQSDINKCNPLIYIPFSTGATFSTADFSPILLSSVIIHASIPVQQISKIRRFLSGVLKVYFNLSSPGFHPLIGKTLLSHLVR